MYRSGIISEKEGKVQRFRLFRAGEGITCSQVYHLWQNDDGFRDFFIESLADSPYQAFRWETPPVTAETAQQGFEFVLIESVYPSSSANPSAFRDQFSGQSSESVVVFPNLGKDAVLVVPTPGENPNVYAHLASFLRDAPKHQVHALWSLIGKTMLDRLGENRIWLNTAGGGVPWLHVRLDSYPKYYVYWQYREYA